MERSISLDSFTSLTDEEVVTQVLSGSAELFEVIVRRYNQPLYRIIRSYMAEEEDINDVMQTTYLKAFEHLDQFRAEAKFSTWIIRIAINEALKLLKQKKRTADFCSVTDTADHNQIDITTIVTPESKVIQKDMNALIEQAIDRLPLKYRSVFVMREMEQMSVREAADCLNISQVNVKVRLHRAKKLIYAELMKTADYNSLFSFMGARCDSLTEQVIRKITAT